MVAPRRHGVEYGVEVAGDRLLILHNDGAENFELAAAPLPGAPGYGDAASWTPVIAHRADTRLLSVDAFADYLVLSYRRDGLTGLSVLPASGAGPERPVTFPEPLYTVGPGSNPEYTQTRFRLGYTSLVTPSTVYDLDLATGALTLLKQQQVLPSPSGVGYDPAAYEQYREWAVAADGTRVPISIVCRKGTPRDGSAPCLLYGYGSYEISIDPSFSIPRLSLLDRGFVFAIAHIRGGGEMGRPWYDDGKMLTKRNTFTDFVASRRAPGRGRLDVPVAAGRPGRVGRRAADGRGRQPGAVGVRRDRRPGPVRRRAELDPRPVAAAHRDRVGGVGRPAARPAVYEYMKSYTPYENVAAAAYPAIFAITSLNDTRVLYHEPAKWIGAAARGRLGRAVPAEDGDGGRARRPQRALRRLAGRGARAGLDHRHRERGLAGRHWPGRA